MPPSYIITFCLSFFAMKFRNLIVPAMLSLALAAGAQSVSEPMYMVLQLAGGQSKAIDIDHINRLTFSDAQMNVEMKDATVEKVDIAAISNMEFSHNSVGGVESAITDGVSFEFSAESAAISFTGVAGAEFAVYDSNGRKMLGFKTGEGHQTLDVSVLPAGVYVATYNGLAFKFLKK